MEKMKAIVVRKYGGPEVMTLEEIAVPEPGEDELLIRVHSCGVNPADWQIRSGKRHKLQEPFSYIPGFDFAGVVAATGQNVSSFQVGDAVYGGSGGTYAEYISCPANTLALKPASVNFLASVEGSTCNRDGLRTQRRISATTGSRPVHQLSDK
ncbi:hypothetical protein FJZ31_37450 [Candidatus Poribacteria bacterium]|nr:hypothetical protein [Candidatus Poribacteria bacterium]